jgi:AraC family transcriptional regulator
MFHPKMSAVTQGFTVVGELKFRSWHGALTDVWTVEAKAGATGEYVSQHPRLFVVLDEDPVRSIQIHSDASKSMDQAPARLSFIPAGMQTWSRVGRDTRLRHLDVHLDVPTLLARFGGELEADRLLNPRLMFENERIVSLARLLADQCVQPSLHDLYGDSLVLALFVELFELRQERRSHSGQLASRALRQAVDYMEDHCLRPIRLQEVADLVGLSQSYFSTAFKASTGLAPHQWQMRARVERVKLRLLARGGSLAQTAQATGFADQAHMTRVFKQFVGATPAAWLRSQVSLCEGRKNVQSSARTDNPMAQ